MKRVGLYIHVPFRIYKHNHRATLSFFNKDFYIKPYFKSLIKELKLRKNDDIVIDSIYIGGGDPSCIDYDYIVDVLNFIYNNFEVESNCEKTIEVDPLTPEYRIKTYIKMGINRFSIRAATFDDMGLRNLDFEHDKLDIQNIISIIRENGVNNINLDMFLFYPGQNLELLEKDINILAKMNIPHLSYYSYKKEEEFIKNKDKKYNENLEFILLETLDNRLTKKGYIHYEINHYSRCGFESYHNKKYWYLSNYIGVGIGASSFFNGIYSKNKSNLELYFKDIDSGKLSFDINEKWTLEDYEKNYIISNMGLSSGINLNLINKKFNINFLEKYKKQIEKYKSEKIIEIVDNHIRFTRKGMYLSNKFFIDIL